jgi:hypothetical protein
MCEKYWDVADIVDEEKQMASLELHFEPGLLPGL